MIDQAGNVKPHHLSPVDELPRVIVMGDRDILEWKKILGGGVTASEINRLEILETRRDH